MTKCKACVSVFSACKGVCVCGCAEVILGKALLAGSPGHDMKLHSSQRSGNSSSGRHAKCPHPLSCLKSRTSTYCKLSHLYLLNCTPHMYFYYIKYALLSPNKNIFLATNFNTKMDNK